MPNPRAWIALGAVLAGLAVTAGAFGAHAMQDESVRASLKLDDRDDEIFEKAVRYQMYHAIGMIVAASLLERGASRALTAACWSFAAGIVFFCGSLYAIVLADVRAFGAVAPIGGTAMILAWAFTAWGAWSAGTTDASEA